MMMLIFFVVVNDDGVIVGVCSCGKMYLKFTTLTVLTYAM